MLEEMGPNDMFLQQAAINKCLKTQLKTGSLPGFLSCVGMILIHLLSYVPFLCFSDS